MGVFRLKISCSLRDSLMAVKFRCTLPYLSEYFSFKVTYSIIELSIFLRVVFNYSCQFFDAFGHLSHDLCFQLFQLFLISTGGI